MLIMITPSRCLAGSNETDRDAILTVELTQMDPGNEGSGTYIIDMKGVARHAKHV